MVDHFSAMPVFPPDLDVYPLFASAVYAEVLLQPGDMLYIPRRWWHWVTSYERNIALSIWHTADQRTINVARDTDSVSRIDSITDSLAFSSRYFSVKDPVLLRTDDVRKWPAFSGWSDDYLLAALGTKLHHVGVSPDPQLQAIKGDHRTRAEVMAFSEFLDRSRTSAEYYYLAQDEEAPILLRDDWKVPDFWRNCFTDTQFHTALWFTFGREEGVTSSLHFDYYENLLVQVAGYKRILLFSRAQTPYLYQARADFIPLAS